jgi:hypothetical protein
LILEIQAAVTQQGSTSLGDPPTTQRGKRRSYPHLEVDFEIPEVYRRYVRWDGTVGLRSTLGWYQRQENNGWRPVNEVRMLNGEDEMPNARHKPSFHFDTSVRREERRRLQKLRHRQWMVALYGYALPQPKL